MKKWWRKIKKNKPYDPTCGGDCIVDAATCPYRMCRTDLAVTSRKKAQKCVKSVVRELKKDKKK